MPPNEPPRSVTDGLGDDLIEAILDKEKEFQPRPAFTIDWERIYSVGPSDHHLHAIGQFIANYSMVEWKLAELFAFALGKPVADAQRIWVETNMSIAGMVRYTKSKLSGVEGYGETPAQDLIYTIEAFERLAPTRNKIVHWQWGLNEGDEATLTDLIKPKAPEKSNAVMSLSDLRDHCMTLVRIYQALLLGIEVVTGRMTREQILAFREGTSPERLFRP